MRVRARAFLAAMPLALVSSWASRAEASPSAVEVRCPELMPESERAAALEARALLELSVRSQEGTLAVDCTLDRVNLTWQPRSGETRELALEPQPSESLADRVISALDQLTRAPSPPAPFRPVVPVRVRAPRQSPDAPAPSLGVVSGAVTEWWSGSNGASLGLSLGGALHSERWRGSLQGMVQRRVSSDELGFQLWAYRGRAMIDYAWLTGALRLELGAGVAAGSFRVTAPAGFTPSSRGVFALGATLRLRAAWHVSRVTVAVGPETTLNLVRPSLIIADRDAATLSPLSWGGAGDVYFWF